MEEINMKGKDLIKFIQENNLEDAIVTVTATMYYQGDHDCTTTDDIDMSIGSMRVKANSEEKTKYVDVPTIDIYVDSNLY